MVGSSPKTTSMNEAYRSQRLYRDSGYHDLLTLHDLYARRDAFLKTAYKPIRSALLM